MMWDEGGALKGEKRSEQEKKRPNKKPGVQRKGLIQVRGKEEPYLPKIVRET